MRNALRKTTYSHVCFLKFKANVEVLSVDGRGNRKMGIETRIEWRKETKQQHQIRKRKTETSFQ